MPTNNPWVNPYQRSFNSIKEQIKNSLRQNVPEITDYSEGNIFIIIISIFSAIAEVLHYYIDNMARETFFSSARRYSSLYKHAKLVDYHIKSAVPASVDLTLYTKDGKPLESSFTIPTGTVFNSADGKSWMVTNKDGIYWDKDLYPKSIRVPVVQKEPIGQTHQINFSSSSFNKNLQVAIQGIPEGKKYVEGSMFLTIDGEPWEEVETFAYSGPLSKVYKVELDGNLTPTIIFGDGIFGMTPMGHSLDGSFYVTTGAEGNIPANSFDSMPSIPGANTSNIGVTNYNAASGGSDYETFDMLKEHVPLSIKTLGVAITKEDFEAFAKLVPGVNKAYAEYICGKEVRIYITPDNGEVEASEALIQEVTAKLNESKVITTSISVLPVHKALIFIDADVTGNKSFKAIDIQKQIISALEEAYGYNNAELGRSVKISDVYSIIDGVSTVDYLTLNRLYILPEPILLSSAGSGAISPALNVTTFSQERYSLDNPENPFIGIYVTITENGYTLQTEENTYEGTFGTSLYVNEENIEFEITLGDSTAAYNVGDRYYFYVGPMNTNVGSKDDTTYKAIPIFNNRSDTLILTIHEQV